MAALLRDACYSGAYRRRGELAGEQPESIFRDRLPARREQMDPRTNREQIVPKGARRVPPVYSADASTFTVAENVQPGIAIDTLGDTTTPPSGPVGEFLVCRE